jgi:protein O-mannosyl-transferase
MSTKHSSPTPAAPATGWRLWLALIVITVSGFAVYAGSLHGEFVFDDLHTIVESPNVRSLTPLTKSLTGEPGSTVSGRPVPAFSLALNYAAGELDVFGYHLVNVTLHVLAALALFGLLLATLSRLADERLRRGALPLAFATSLLWVLHPLHTDALNHVSYRTETMLALFYFAALFAAARGFAAREPKRWYVLAVSCAFLAVGSKEAAVSLPLIVLVYDRQFAAGSFGAAVRRRRGFYAALFSCWILLGVLVLTGDRGTSVGFEIERVSSVDYLRTQARGLWMYLKLVIWPRPLVFDYYGIPIEQSWGPVALHALGLVALFGWTVRGVVQKRAWSVPALATFAVLAPSSSFIPLAGEVLAEHRMVLPIAALLSLAALGVYQVLPRASFGLALLLPTAGAFAYLTVERNADYRTQESIWRDTVEKRPDNARALNNLFKPLIERGDLEEAQSVLRRSLALRGKSVRAWNNLGVLMTRMERWDEAEEAFAKSLELQPDHVNTHYNFAQFLSTRERWGDAVKHYAIVARDTPGAPRGHVGLGLALLRLGKRGQSAEAFRGALRADGRNATALRTLAWILSTSRDPALRNGAEALQLATALCASGPQPKPRQQEVLAAALAENGRYEEAVALSREAAKAARAQGDLQLARSIRARSQIYARGEPYRE